MNPDQTPNPNEQNNSQGVKPTVSLNNIDVSVVRNTQPLQASPQPLTPPVTSDQSGPFVSVIAPDTPIESNSPKKSKTIILVIVVAILLIFIALVLYFFVFHTSSKAPPTKSVVSTTTKPPATKTATPNCPAVSGVALCGYTAQINSVDVPAVQVSTLFLQNATTNLDPNATELDTTTSELSLDYLANPATSVVQPCTSDPSSSGPELFSYTSNGTSQVACGGKSTGDNGYAYTYGSIININGMDYGIALFSQSPVTNPVVEAIFTSVKPS